MTTGSHGSDRALTSGVLGEAHYSLPSAERALRMALCRMGFIQDCEERGASPA